MKTSILSRARNTVAGWISDTPRNGASHTRRFQAARIDRLAADWVATQASINEELRSDLDRLRARGRELKHNNDYAAKFVEMVQTNIIGPDGVRLQLRVEDSPGKPDRTANKAIEAGWAEWSSACDVTGQLTLRDLCNNLVGAMPSDGEFMLRVVIGSEAGNKFGIALQVIDVDRIDTTYNVAAAGNRNAVIMGVEVDAYRRPQAYHIFQSHPSEGIQSNRQRTRIDARNIIHRFKVTRAEQVRGIPWMAPGMLSLHHLGSFKLAALLNAENGANHFGFFEAPEGAPPIGKEEADGTKVTTSQPGMYDTLPPGYKYIQHESKYPNEVFGPFVKTTLQRIASGWGVAYHSLANDLEGVSFSSIRSGTLEERDRWAADQAWFIAAMLEPVYQLWIQVALLKGAITLPNGSALPASKIGKFSAHEWQPRRWDWVDPKADTESRILTVRAGLVAPQDIAASMGYDFEDTMIKISDAQKLAKELGVKLTAYESTPGANGAAPADPQPAKTALKPART